MLLKCIKGAAKHHDLNKMTAGTLNVVFRNKPLIELSAIKKSYSNAYYDIDESKFSPLNQVSSSLSLPDNRMPVFLSTDEEMLLFRE
jgi:hypothetical protein